MQRMRSGICALGDNVVDRYLDRHEMYPGGNAVNVAVHVRRLGTRAAYIGVVGTDAAGRLVAGSLRDEGVLTDRMRTESGANAWAAVQLVGGDRVFVGSDKGVSRFTLDEGDLAYLEGFEMAHVGYAAGLEEQVPAIAGRVKLSFDFADKPRDFAAPLLPHCEIATFSAGEGGIHAADAIIDWALGLGAGSVLVTAGGAGAVAGDALGRDHVPAETITVVDTLGAGDAYISAYLVATLKGTDRVAAMRGAARYAADVCQQYGAYGYRSADSLPLIG